jgi:glycosyltransferase involved in cell wall biosynthesis/peptidoglycan/xylan/chitin deacetylase (PgdA/CDA1 family)
VLSLKTKAYYFLKPLVPQFVVVGLRQWLGRRRRVAHAATWPIDEGAGATPPNWPGWPDGKQFAFVLTHDIEGPKGVAKVPQLLELEAGQGMRASYNFVPGDGEIPADLRKAVETAGSEIGIHGLEHDGKLFFSKSLFFEKAQRIREYMREWGAVGFRAPFMHHRLSWQHQLRAEYDASTFDTDPFEPQPDGVRTIFPFWVPGRVPEEGYVELPYTLVQDFTLFRILNEPDIAIWKNKLDWVAAHGGMALLDSHPDYMHFDEGPAPAGTYPAALYAEFLAYAKEKYGAVFWHALPREVASYYKSALPDPNERNSRKRICMVTHSNYETDNRVRRYAEALARRGDLVDVIAIETGDAPLGEKTIAGVRLITVQRRVRNEKSQWTYAYRLLRFLLVSSIELTRRHADIRYDLVHVHNIPDFQVFSAWYAKVTGAKVILDIHDIVPELFSTKFKSKVNDLYVGLLKKIEKASAAFADHVIIANHLWVERITARSAPARKCTVFINHVDNRGLFHRRARTRPVGPKEPLVILFHGTFQWHQGLDIAVEALSLLKDRVPSAELHLYGGGGGRNSAEQLIEQAQKLDVGDRVKYFGSVPLHRIPEIVANADLGIVPKRADSFGNEAYSTKITEYLSQGVPAVVSRTKIDTYYFDPNTVQFFESGNSRDMADAMVEVLTNHKRREALIKSGLEYVERNSWETRKPAYFDLVDSLVVEQFLEEEKKAQSAADAGF